jgi:catechol 2,3-dioxygenase-like lactoylglutathione lyase family enzyme
MPADEYGRRLPKFSVNLIVAEIARSVKFYKEVLGAKEVYSDVDFAALEIVGLEFMLHADHAYDQHPWFANLTNTPQRGLGAELRLFGVSPDAVEARAKRVGARLLQPVTDKAHGWRDVIVADPDGYAWAVGLPTKKAPSA